MERDEEVMSSNWVLNAIATSSSGMVVERRLRWEVVGLEAWRTHRGELIRMVWGRVFHWHGDELKEVGGRWDRLGLCWYWYSGKRV